MNSQSKGYSLILYLIWPFSALIIAIKNFDAVFGRRLLIALYAFLGFTVFSVGDLLRYEDDFYAYQTESLSQILTELTSLQTGKFYNSLISLVVGFFFNSHHFYFLILFFCYGYFYINTVNLLRGVSFKKLNKFGLFFFFGMLLFLLIRPIYNLAFYTGGVFILFSMVSYYKSNNKKYLLLLCLSPLFHIGLSIYLILPLFLILFKNRTLLYLIFVVVTFAAGKSSVVGLIESFASTNSNTIIESKYNAYADEEGRASLDERYAEGEVTSNIKLKSLNFLQDAIMYFFVPLGLGLLLWKRKYLLINEEVKRLFHITLLFFGIANLMLNISQGERFVLLFSFISIGLFFCVYLKTSPFSKKTIFSKFLILFVPVIFIYGLMVAYASNDMISYRFFTSNFYLEFFRYEFLSFK